MDYQKAYGILFRAITRAIEKNNLNHGVAILVQAQQITEEMYIEGDD